MLFDLTTAFNDLEALRREIDGVFNRSGYHGTPSFPLINVYENNEDVTVLAELPGFTRENLNITVNENTLILSGKRENKNYGEKVETLRRERATGEFEKTLKLPATLDKEKISANFTDGILAIKLPKKEEARPRKIEIQA